MRCSRSIGAEKGEKNSDWNGEAKRLYRRRRGAGLVNNKGEVTVKRGQRRRKGQEKVMREKVKGESDEGRSPLILCLILNEKGLQKEMK